MVSADQLTQERRRFNLEDYIGEILFTLQPKTRKYQHSIEVSCSKDLTLDSYPGAYAQIITNLLMNSLIHAYDHNNKGTITISAVPKGDEIIVEYKDDGKGISEEDLKHIFDPFFTTKRGAGGMGLGLHIVFNTVTQTLGGRIECKSTLGKGTAFIINVPVRTEGTA
ncbi:MAG: HAMP domain-containing histidine kinase [Nitrospirota bacterium]